VARKSEVEKQTVIEQFVDVSNRFDMDGAAGD
jgi:hypothetical protein